uniref:ATP synthase complex subunit 8 n=1 Tax=Podarcis siculus TaxID=65484 RepID=A0A5P8PAM9_PODSI|nr:ATP synthase F0 subunit 8 [Podarcis siculus]QFR52784.1 ATP synthase F0 subunit 8 [Podarcis siculus]QFR52797.1 ATP synthase F0 subunit 8 [Podarcis siculus]QFR52810.1 ATP synthase F0 subunit 8 [Podarcis siculus]QFR52823.1 ATP synthase F0 subunit 8 [Podarcis siculus]
MPQLNPAPWFLTFVLVWVTLVMFFSKIINTNSHLSTPQYKKLPNNHYWTWPWP